MPTLNRRTRRRARAGLGLLAGLCLLHPVHAQAAKPRTKVLLNGKLVHVSFYDGDSFRVLNGELKKAKARLSGFNTLEAYGPVHQWGTWTAKELHVIAKMATLHSRKGTWECETDGNLDTRGRMQVWCPELAEELIRRGMAHVMTNDDSPGDPTLVAAQKEAIEARRGIWAHGVPDFILMSVRSMDETATSSRNRLVSTQDGHLMSWLHSDEYDECQRVCWMNYEVDEAKVQEVFKWVRDSASGQRLAEEISDEALLQAIRDYAKYRAVDHRVPRKLRRNLYFVMKAYESELGDDDGKPAACMDYVPIKRRDGTGRAQCLK